MSKNYNDDLEYVVTDLEYRVSDLEQRADWFVQTMAATLILLDQSLPTNRLGNLLVLNPGTGNYTEARQDVQELYQKFRTEVKKARQYLEQLQEGV